MAPEQILQSPGERGRVERPAQAHRDDNVVSGAGAFHAVEEPQPLLRKGERDALRSLHGLQPLRSKRGFTQLRAKSGNAGGFEERPQGEFDTQHRTDATDEARREQRMTTELEEVVVDADAG